MAYEQLKLDNQLCFRLYTVSRLVIQAYRPYLEPLGITYPQYMVLMVLWEHDCQPVNTIAQRLMLETNTVTPMLQRMEKLDIIVRRRGQDDKRQQIVSLTVKGKAMERQAFETIPAGMKKSLEKCVLRQEEYQQLAAQVDSIIESLKSETGHHDDR